MMLEINNKISISKSDDLESFAFTDEDKKLEYIYQGETSNDKLNGYGKLWNNIFNYTGYFKDNLFDKNGILTNIGNEENDKYFVLSYDGEFKDGKKSGLGIERYNNGEYYEGQFNYDLRHGKGILYNQNGTIKIESNWDMGSAVDSTSITEYYSNGNLKYKGQYDGIYWNGKGVYCEKNNNLLFDGIFEKNRFKSGKLISSKGTIIFEGDFSHFGNFSYPSKGKVFDSNGFLITDGSFELDSKEDDKINLFVKDSDKHYSDNKLLFQGKISSDDRFLKKYSDLFPDHISLKCKYFDDKELLIFGFYQNGVQYYSEGNKKHYVYDMDETFENGTVTGYSTEGNIGSKLTLKNSKIDGENININKTNQNDYIISLFDMDFEVERKIYKVGLSNISPTEKLKYHFKYYKDSNLNDLKVYHNNGLLAYDGKTKSYDNSYKYEGFGKLYELSINNVSQSETYKLYEGNFENSKFHGNGILFYQNEFMKYEGDFKLGKFEGNGISYYETSGLKEYEGEWANSEKHGQGSLFSEDGTLVFTGRFHYGEMQFE